MSSSTMNSLASLLMSQWALDASSLIASSAAVGSSANSVGISPPHHLALEQVGRQALGIQYDRGHVVAKQLMLLLQNVNSLKFLDA